MADNQFEIDHRIAEETIFDWKSEGYDDPDEYKAMAMIYHAEQVRHASEQLERIADALESDQQ